MKKKPYFNQNINLTIQEIGKNGEGIGYWHGYTIFVDNAIPGEVITAQVIEQKENYGRAKIIDLLKVSSDRINVDCPYYGKCGSCQLRHLSYKKQLKIKKEKVEKAFQDQNLYKPGLIKDCSPSTKQLYYRNKIQFPIRTIEGQLHVGFYARLSNDFIPIKGCEVHDQKAQQLFDEIFSQLTASSLLGYDPILHSGCLRHLLVRYAKNTDQAIVVFVTNEKEKNPILEALAKEIIKKHPQIKGILQNSNTKKDNAILGEDFFLLAGRNIIQEKIGDLCFEISATSFLQINIEQAENIYNHAFHLADLQKDEVILDAYCGVGTLSLFFAKKAKKVIGIENVLEAVQNAKRNGKINKIHNVEFLCGRVEDKMKDLEKIDVAILNPPRCGCKLSVLEKLKDLQAKKIIYLSCNPTSLVNDLKHLSLFYEIKSVKPFDMFPQTSHVEILAYLEQQ